ncbi:helix-turn-helix transcriptional regulator [Aquidulcibacter paucihalophilus]|nr:helix-turn-helix transcriptional regulator [Aquidulcibacter paucihalophilus]
MGHALLKTPGGEDLVVLPRADYDRLVADAEMLADVAAHDATTEAVAKGREEFVPVALVDAMLAGENPVRAWRRYRGLTIARLAEIAGLSAAYISQIETGTRAGTVETLGRIAAALTVDLDDLT